MISQLGMTLYRHIILFIATGAFVGKIPVMPGTLGTLPGLLLCYGLSGLDLVPVFFLLFAIIGIAVWSAGAAERIIAQKDPGMIVIDEIAGIAVTLCGFPFSAGYVLAGFVLFRFFDILKPWPIGWADKRLHGGVGIVLDDVIAGIMANMTLHGAAWFVLG